MIEKLRNPFMAIFPSTIKSQIIIMVSVLVIFHIMISGIIFQGLLAEHLEEDIGEKALSIAKTVAKMPQVKNALEHGDQDGSIQVLAESIRVDIGAKFVVIGDVDGIRLSHPTPGNIGKRFMGGDFIRAVTNGEAYTSNSIGTLGPSLRGFAPIFLDNGKLSGFVSVGYLEVNILKTVQQAQRRLSTYIFMIMLVGLIGASLIAGYIKRVTLNMEPSEIASLHIEREIILNAMREGILAINARGVIRFANYEALRLLGVESSVKGELVQTVLPEAGLIMRMEEDASADDVEMIIGKHAMLFNIHTVIINNKLLGLVASFRRKDEIDYLNKELGLVKSCSDLLRVQSHEYYNKLHTISGLIQLEEYEEAKALILKESYIFHDLMEYLENNVLCPMVNGMLIGKFNKASELKCEFDVDFNGGWKDQPTFPEHMVTVLGNLIDNAMDAVLDNNKEIPIIHIALTESDTDFIALVEDNGPGVPMDLNIFEKGVTTKIHGQGIGLFNVSKALQVMRGSIRTERSHLGGACFTVTIPKRWRV